MSSEEKQSDQRLETVLDFLSKEIAATSGPVQGQESQAEDIDSVVSNLLQKVVRDSEAASENTAHELERSSIDSMFAGMLGHDELKANPQGIFESAVSQADTAPDATRKDIGVAGKGNVRHFPVERPQTQVAGSLEAALPIQPPAEKSSASAKAAPVSGKIVMPAPASRASKGESKPAARSSALLIIIGCLAVVLAAAGAYILVNRTGSESDAVSTSMPAESADNPANAPMQVDEKNSAVASNRSSASGNQGLSNTRNEPANTPAEAPAVRRPTAAAEVADNSPAERASSRATPPAAEETVANYSAPAAVQVPAPPSEALPGFSLPALPQSSQSGVAAPVMITAPAQVRAPARPAAKPIVAPSPAPVQAVATPKVVPSQSLVQAVAIQRVAPVYPELAKKYKVTGTVILDIQISDAGRVTQAAAVSGPQMLHSAAMAAVRQWRFKPASLNGNNVSSNGTVSIVFNTPK